METTSKKFYQCDCGVSFLNESGYNKHREICGKIGRERFDAKIKRKRGLVRYPVLLAIVAVSIILGSGVYISVQKVAKYESKRLQEALQEKEKELALVKEREQLQAQIASTTEEIEKLKKQVRKTEAKIAAQPQPQKDLQQNLEIKSADTEPYLEGVQQIKCFEPDNKSGSSSLWNIEGLGYVALTNSHVISGSAICNLIIADDSDFQIKGLYPLSKSNFYQWNLNTDVAALRIEMFPTQDGHFQSKPLTELNYKISSLRKCPARMSLGSPVITLGFPAYSQKTVAVEGFPITQSFRTITNGIISAYDTSVQKPVGQLPYPNYYVSAKIDSGNSGGIAFSKDKDGLCVLGLPTWLSVGNYETQGVVQNIHNVFYKN